MVFFFLKNMFSISTHSEGLHTNCEDSAGVTTGFIKELLLYVSPRENLTSGFEKCGNLILYKSFHRCLFDVHANIPKPKNL